MNPMFYFLLALTAVLAATTANAGDEPVVDINGDVIKEDVSYYIVPVGQGGGVNLASHGAKQCPLEVVQVSSHDDKGIPVKFSNSRGGGYVPELEGLNIKMDIDSTICGQSTYWSFKLLTGVTVGPKSFFQIESVGAYYKFVICTLGCRDIGIKVEKNGNRHLVLSGKPFVFMLRKAGEQEGSSKTMSI